MYTPQRIRHGRMPEPLERPPTTALALPVARHTRPLSLPSWHKCRKYLPGKTRATCSDCSGSKDSKNETGQASSLPVQRLQSSMRSCLRTVGPVLCTKKIEVGLRILGLMLAVTRFGRDSATLPFGMSRRLCKGFAKKQTSSTLCTGYRFALHVWRLAMKPTSCF